MVFLELQRDSRVTTGISGFPLGWPWEAQSSPRVARESWGWRSSHCRAEETSPKRNEEGAEAHSVRASPAAVRGPYCIGHCAGPRRPPKLSTWTQFFHWSAGFGEPGRAPPRHAHGDLTSVAPHETLPELPVVPRVKPHTGAVARENPQDPSVIAR